MENIEFKDTTQGKTTPGEESTDPISPSFTAMPRVKITEVHEKVASTLQIEVEHTKLEIDECEAEQLEKQRPLCRGLLGARGQVRIT